MLRPPCRDRGVSGWLALRRVGKGSGTDLEAPDPNGRGGGHPEGYPDATFTRSAASTVNARVLLSTRIRKPRCRPPPQATRDRRRAPLGPSRAAGGFRVL